MSNDVEALATVHRLEQMGITVRSPSLRDTAKQLNAFNAAGGNRAMRRATARASRRGR